MLQSHQEMLQDIRGAVCVPTGLPLPEFTKIYLAVMATLAPNTQTPEQATAPATAAFHRQNRPAAATTGAEAQKTAAPGGTQDNPIQINATQDNDDNSQGFHSQDGAQGSGDSGVNFAPDANPETEEQKSPAEDSPRHSQSPSSESQTSAQHQATSEAPAQKNQPPPPAQKQVPHEDLAQDSQTPAEQPPVQETAAQLQDNPPAATTQPQAQVRDTTAQPPTPPAPVPDQRPKPTAQPQADNQAPAQDDQDQPAATTQSQAQARASPERPADHVPAEQPTRSASPAEARSITPPRARGTDTLGRRERAAAATDVPPRKKKRLQGSDTLPRRQLSPAATAPPRETTPAPAPAPTSDLTAARKQRKRERAGRQQHAPTHEPSPPVQQPNRGLDTLTSVADELEEEEEPPLRRRSKQARATADLGGSPSPRFKKKAALLLQKGGKDVRRSLKKLKGLKPPKTKVAVMDPDSSGPEEVDPQADPRSGSESPQVLAHRSKVETTWKKKKVSPNPSSVSNGHKTKFLAKTATAHHAKTARERVNETQVNLEEPTVTEPTFSVGLTTAQLNAVSQILQLTENVELEFHWTSAHNLPSDFLAMLEHGLNILVQSRWLLESNPLVYSFLKPEPGAELTVEFQTAWQIVALFMRLCLASQFLHATAAGVYATTLGVKSNNPPRFVTEFMLPR